MRILPDKSLLKLRHGAEYGVLRALGALIRAMPVDTASAVVGRLWRWIAPRTRRHARALDHVAAAYPELSAAERERLVRDMWENLGRITGETFHLHRLARERDRYSYDIEEARAAIEAGSGGCVVVSMHSGNWEIAAEPGLAAGLETAGVYQALSNPLADRYLTALRAPFYPAGLFPKGHDTARRLLAHVRAGGAIAFLADLRDVRGVRVPFFGRPAWATPFPVMIARSTGVPLIACRVVRKDGVRFHFEAVPLEIPRDGDRKDDIAAGTALVHARFESWIREHPSQWMWIHRKWIGT